MKSLNHSHSIQFKIGIVFLGLVAVALCVVWLMQGLFFDNTYKTIKTNTLKQDTNLIVKNINSEDLEPLITRLSTGDDISLMLATSDGEVIAEHHDAYSQIYGLSSDSIAEYYREALSHDNGQYLQDAREVPVDYSYDSGNYVGDVPENIGKSSEKYIVFAEVAQSSEGDEYVIIASSLFIDGDILNGTVVFQSVIISVVFLIMGVVTTIIISKSVVKPLVSLTKSAKKLAEGKTDVKFEAEGFSEVEELSDVLNHTAKELDEVEKMRRELIANVSHDLRTPLTLIKGYGELMRDIPSERQSENLQIVIDESERLTKLVNDMLDLSRIQQDKNKVVLKEFDIVKTTDALVNRVSSMLKAKDYIVEYNKEMFGVMVYGDEDKMLQVIYNMISNAINYAGEDKKIIVNITKKDKNVRISVADHGIGIDVNDLSHIWDRYYKSDKNHVRPTLGTGLGLSIVKTVMNAHPGGVYGVNTSVGNGSTFYVELPIKQIINPPENNVAEHLKNDRP